MVLKTFFFLFLIGLVIIGTTDADFIDKKVVADNKMSATTLNFSEANTATNTPMSRLFDLKGIVPGGFQVNAIRLKNEGQSNLFYKITSEIIDGDQDFCKSLELEMNDGKSNYKSNLVDLSHSSPALNPNTQTDWIIFVRFNKSEKELQNKSCHFNLVFNGFNKNPADNPGLKHKKIVENSVSSGSWN